MRIYFSPYRLFPDTLLLPNTDEATSTSSRAGGPAATSSSSPFSSAPGTTLPDHDLVRSAASCVDPATSAASKSKHEPAAGGLLLLLSSPVAYSRPLVASCLDPASSSMLQDSIFSPGWPAMLCC